MSRSTHALTLIAVLAGVAGAHAQTSTATIVGTVYDASRAIIPTVTLRANNLQTGLERQAATDDSGHYVLPSLPAGEYSLSAEHPGFRRETVKAFTLQVNQTARLDFTLQPGTVSESIEVESIAPLLNTDTAAISQVIENRRIVELPLNGRQFLELALLVPGATTGNGGPQNGQSSLFSRPSANASVSVNGARAQNNSFLLDGVQNTDGNVNTFIFSPSVDAIQEFRVETSNYSAEFGRSSGAQINVITKSGTNGFHGGLYHFLRNNALDARPFNNPGPLPAYRFNQFGATLGGPVRENRTFFFAHYEGLRLVQGGSRILSVPTAAQRAGDFTGLRPIYDPDTLAPDPTDPAGLRRARQQFPGNVIPRERLNPIATRLLNGFVPLPNLPGLTNNYLDTRPQRQRNNQEGLRIDHRLTDSGLLFGRYSVSNETGFVPAGLPGSGTISAVRAQHAVLGETHTLSPNLVNEARFGFARLRLERLSENAFRRDVVTELGIPGTQFAGPEVWGVPSVTIPGYSTLGDDNFFLPLLLRNNTFHLVDTLSWTRGAHTLRFGGDLRRFQFNITQIFTPRGDFRFSANYTNRFAGTATGDTAGDALASFLLGLPQQQRRTVGTPNAYLRQLAYSGFVQDDWKVRPNLTLNLGVRYEFTSPFVDKYDRLSNVSFEGIPTINEIAERGEQGRYAVPIVIAGRNGTPRATTRSDRNNWAPRFGFAYRPARNNVWVVRGGFGVFFGAQDGEHVGRASINIPFVVSDIQNSDAFLPQIRGIGFTASPGVGNNDLRQVIVGLDGNLRTPYTFQWNFAVQRSLGNSLAAEVAYVGSGSRKLDTRNAMNDALPGPGNLDTRRFFQRLILPEASTLQGFDLPAPILGREVLAGTIEIQTNRVNASYHALQTKLEKRFSAGLSFLTSYTWSKSISDGNSYRRQGIQGELAQNFLQNSEKALTGFDVRHRFVTSFLYELPFCRTSQACFGSRVARAVLGGWSTNGIVQAQTGFPFTVLLANATANNGRSTRPNVVLGQDPNLPEDQRTTSRWFNTTAFAAPAPFTLGKAGVNTVTGPGLFTTDFALLKSTRLTERASLQFRSEFFNLFNHVNYGQPNPQLGSPQFGTVTSQSVPPRQIQFGLKLLF